MHADLFDVRPDVVLSNGTFCWKKLLESVRVLSVCPFIIGVRSLLSFSRKKPKIQNVQQVCTFLSPDALVY